MQGNCIRAIIEDKKDFEKYKGKLAGMIVILGAEIEAKPITDAPFKRLSDDDLAKLSDYQSRDRTRTLPLCRHLEAHAVHQRLKPVLGR